MNRDFSNILLTFADMEAELDWCWHLLTGEVDTGKFSCDNLYSNFGYLKKQYFVLNLEILKISYFDLWTKACSLVNLNVYINSITVKLFPGLVLVEYFKFTIGIWTFWINYNGRWWGWIFLKNNVNTYALMSNSFLNRNVSLF